MARTRREPAAHPICCLDAYRRSRMAPCSGRSPAEIREQGCRHSAICLHQYAGSWCCTCVLSRQYDESLNASVSRSEWMDRRHERGRARDATAEWLVAAVGGHSGDPPPQDNGKGIGKVYRGVKI